MTAEQTKEILVTTAKLLQEQMLQAPVDADLATGALGRRESLEHVGRLVSSLQAIPVGDPRFQRIATRFATPDALADSVVDGLVPGDADGLLDHLAEAREPWDDEALDRIERAEEEAEV